MKDLLVVSAVDFEVRPLCQRLKARGIPHRTAHTGIGSLAAAASALELGRLSTGCHVIFVGTAGTFASFEQPFLCTASRVCWLPSGERTGISYGIPRGKLHALALEPSARIGLPEKTVLCSPSISMTSAFAPDWEKELIPGDCVENLELWSCAAALKAGAKRLDVILGITNQIGPNAHEQWVKWHGQAAEMTAAHVEKYLCEN
ncbi:MAG: hypothetical protein RIQ81_2403 [Pseudomonadota bacterium]|jgi:purine-nucleoside phosphorylase